MLTADQRIGANVAELRKLRNLSIRRLAELMTSHGHKLFPSTMTALEQGKRRATAAEVLALAGILGVNPNRILMPWRADDTPAALTPTVVVPAGIAWYWADGALPIPAFYDADQRPEELAMGFRRDVRPVEHQVRAEHPAHRAALGLKTRIDMMLDVLRRDGVDQQRRSAVAASTQRALAWVVAEVRALLVENTPRDPAIVHIERTDGFTGEEHGVQFRDGVATIRENHAAAGMFTGPGYRVTVIPVEAVSATFATPTFGDLAAGNPELFHHRPESGEEAPRGER